MILFQITDTEIYTHTKRGREGERERQIETLRQDSHLPGPLQSLSPPTVVARTPVLTWCLLGYEVGIERRDLILCILKYSVGVSNGLLISMPNSFC